MSDKKKEKAKSGGADMDREKLRREVEEKEDARLEEYGQMTLDGNAGKRNIYLLSIIGEVEGHENLPGTSKATKYDHVLPKLAQLEDDAEVEGLLVLLNTSGGDVDAGLAIAEMIASLSMPTVSLVLGGSHSIGVPLAVAADYSFIVPTGTMMIHPVRMTGLIIGVPQTFEYFKLIQDRITGFVCKHCKISRTKLEELMMETGFLTKDVGSILVGEEAVNHGIIDEVGGIDRAICRLRKMIEGNRKRDDKAMEK